MENKTNFLITPGQEYVLRHLGLAHDAWIDAIEFFTDDSGLIEFTVLRNSLSLKSYEYSFILSFYFKFLQVGLFACFADYPCSRRLSPTRSVQANLTETKKFTVDAVAGYNYISLKEIEVHIPRLYSLIVRPLNISICSDNLTNFQYTDFILDRKTNSIYAINKTSTPYFKINIRLYVNYTKYYSWFSMKHQFNSIGDFLVSGISAATNFTSKNSTVQVQSSKFSCFIGLFMRIIQYPSFPDHNLKKIPIMVVKI